MLNHNYLCCGAEEIWQRRQIRGYSEEEEKVRISMLAELWVFVFSIQNQYLNCDVNTFETEANSGY